MLVVKKAVEKVEMTAVLLADKKGLEKVVLKDSTTAAERVAVLEAKTVGRKD